MKYVVRIDHDSDTEMPESGYDGWRLFSLNSRHVSHKGVTGLLPNGKPTMALRNKLRVGLAHLLSYYEHGQCAWMLASGPHPAGVEFDWDGVRFAGVAVWMGKPSDIGGKTVDERRKDCGNFLEEYTHWCNGECYWFSIEEVEHDDDDREYADRKQLDSAGGFIGSDCVAEAVREAMPDDATKENTSLVGMARDIACYNDIFKKACPA